MLAQDKPACADKAAKQNGEAQPPSGVKRKYLGESQQCADDAAGSSRVCTHFYPIVEHGAHYLQRKRPGDDAKRETRHMHALH